MQLQNERDELIENKQLTERKFEELSSQYRKAIGELTNQKDAVIKEINDQLNDTLNQKMTFESELREKEAEINQLKSHYQQLSQTTSNEYDQEKKQLPRISQLESEKE